LLVGKFLIRKNGIERIGELSARIRADFQDSIDAGFPVVAVLTAYHQEIDTGRVNKTTIVGNHAVTIVGISKRSDNNQFFLKIVNPEPDFAGKQLQFVRVYEYPGPFNALYRETSEALFHMAIGKTPADGASPLGGINSPMLLVEVPSGFWQNKNVNYTTLEFAMGHISPEYDY